jgi:hypothetical protein
MVPNQDDRTASGSGNMEDAETSTATRPQVRVAYMGCYCGTADCLLRTASVGGVGRGSPRVMRRVFGSRRLRRVCVRWGSSTMWPSQCPIWRLPLARTGVCSAWRRVHFLSPLVVPGTTQDDRFSPTAVYCDTGEREAGLAGARRFGHICVLGKHQARAASSVRCAPSL